MKCWAALLVTGVLYAGALGSDSHETEIGSASGSRGTTCPCGMSNKGRVVGGSAALANEYPWVVMLGVKMSLFLPPEQICGGSILNEKYVITAAHCTQGSVRSMPFYVIAGISNKNKVSAAQTIRVARFIDHEKYVQPLDAGKTVNDISLLLLSTPLTFNKNVGPICLPAGRLNIDSQFVKVVGWGKLGGSLPASQQLMEADLKVVPYKLCKLQSPLATPQSQLCMQYPGKTACMGDSGGPVVWLDPETNRYTLVGLTSFGSSSCTPGAVTVLTEVSVFLPWIQNKIESEGCHKD